VFEHVVTPFEVEHVPVVDVRYALSTSESPSVVFTQSPSLSSASTIQLRDQVTPRLAGSFSTVAVKAWLDMSAKLNVPVLPPVEAAYVLEVPGAAKVIERTGTLIVTAEVPV